MGKCPGVSVQGISVRGVHVRVGGGGGGLCPRTESKPLFCYLSFAISSLCA